MTLVSHTIRRKPMCFANDDDSNPDMLREAAFQIEDGLVKHTDPITMDRPAAIFVRTALFQLADWIEREL